MRDLSGRTVSLSTFISVINDLAEHLRKTLRILKTSLRRLVNTIERPIPIYLKLSGLLRFSPFGIILYFKTSFSNWFGIWYIASHSAFHSSSVFPYVFAPTFFHQASAITHTAASLTIVKENKPSERFRNTTNLIFRSWNYIYKAKNLEKSFPQCFPSRRLKTLVTGFMHRQISFPVAYDCDTFIIPFFIDSLFNERAVQKQGNFKRRRYWYGVHRGLRPFGIRAVVSHVLSFWKVGYLYVSTGVLAVKPECTRAYNFRELPHGRDCLVAIVQKDDMCYWIYKSCNY